MQSSALVIVLAPTSLTKLPKSVWAPIAGFVSRAAPNVGGFFMHLVSLALRSSKRCLLLKASSGKYSRFPSNASKRSLISVDFSTNGTMVDSIRSFTVDG